MASVQTEFDTHDPSASNLKLAFLRKRSKITEIVAAKNILFALTHYGVCAAFDRGRTQVPGVLTFVYKCNGVQIQ